MPNPSAGVLRRRVSRRLARALAVTLACSAALALGTEPARAQSFGRNKIQYDGFDWHVLQTEHFDVYYYP